MLRVAIITALAVALGGCKARTGSDKVVLSVLAASSLTEALAAIEAEFERSHPQVDVQLVLAGSQVLRLQVEQGIGADVFASANADHVFALHRQGLCDSPVTFARNELALILSPQAQAPASFAQITKISSWVVGSDEVPVGRYTQAWLGKLQGAWGPDAVQRIRSKIRSKEPNVRLVRAKVELGQADAGVVYRSDLRPGPGQRVVAIPPAFNLQANYEIAALAASKHPQLAREFVDFINSPRAQDLLEEHGFIREGS